jgi:hypothetical protein
MGIVLSSMKNHEEQPSEITSDYFPVSKFFFLITLVGPHFEAYPINHFLSGMIPKDSQGDEMLNEGD